MNPRCRSTAGSTFWPASGFGDQATSRISPWFSGRSSNVWRKTRRNRWGRSASAALESDVGRAGASATSTDAARGDRAEVGLAAARRPRDVDDDGVAQLELAPVDDPADAPFASIERDRAVEREHLLGADHRQAPRLDRNPSSAGTGYDCQTAVETASPRSVRPLSSGKASAVGSSGKETLNRVRPVE